MLQCFRGFLRVHLLTLVPHLSSSASTALFFTRWKSALPFAFHSPAVLSLAPILGFVSRVTSPLVCFSSPESPSSTSCYFRASAPCATRSIALAHRKTTASALLDVVLSLSPVPPAPSWGSLQRRGLPVVSPALLCSTLPRRSRWTGATVRYFTLASCLVVSGHSSIQTCVCTDRPVYTPGGAKLLCLHHLSHHFFSRCNALGFTLVDSRSGLSALRLCPSCRSSKD